MKKNSSTFTLRAIIKDSHHQKIVEKKDECQRPNGVNENDLERPYVGFIFNFIYLILIIFISN